MRRKRIGKQITGLLLTLAVFTLVVSGCGKREASEGTHAANILEEQDGKGTSSAQSTVSATGQNASAQNDQNEENSRNTENGQPAAAESLEELKTVWRNADRDLTHEEIQSDLDQAGLFYAGYYNVSGERLDVPMSLYTQKEGSDASISLEKGDEVRVLGGDLNSWVQLEKVSTGEKGWIRVTGSDCTLPDGTVEASSLLFDGLQFYG